MRFQYQMWRLFLATALVALLMALTRPRELWPAVFLLVAAGGMTGLILVCNRKNIGAIVRSVVWTLFGVFFGIFTLWR